MHLEILLLRVVMIYLFSLLYRWGGLWERRGEGEGVICAGAGGDNYICYGSFLMIFSKSPHRSLYSSHLSTPY